jgi:hypothetical protein
VKDAEPWRNHMRDNISIDLGQLRFSGPAFMRRRRTPVLGAAAQSSTWLVTISLLEG